MEGRPDNWSVRPSIAARIAEEIAADESATRAQLVEAAKDAGIPATGNKAKLRSAIADNMPNTGADTKEG